MKTLFRFLAAPLLFAPLAGAAGDLSAGNAAFLFSYYPKKGQQEQFDAGYRKHLAWHRKVRDPLPWYGWYVSTGDRTGMFVDGTFGITFEAFDNRVKPAEDAVDASNTFAPYGDTAYRKVLRLMPHLGTATRLEDREPSGAIEVVTYVVKPGRTDAFESCLERLAASLEDAPAFTVYRQLSGGTQPAYLVMFPRDGFSYFHENTASLDALIRAHPDAETGRELLGSLSENVRRTHSETWHFRQDLSYLPE